MNCQNSDTAQRPSADPRGIFIAKGALFKLYPLEDLPIVYEALDDTPRNNERDCWGSVRTKDGHFFTHKGGIELLDN